MRAQPILWWDDLGLSLVLHEPATFDPRWGCLSRQSQLHRQDLARHQNAPPCESLRKGGVTFAPARASCVPWDTGKKSRPSGANRGGSFVLRRDGRSSRPPSLRPHTMRTSSSKKAKSLSIGFRVAFALLASAGYAAHARAGDVIFVCTYLYTDPLNLYKCVYRCHRGNQIERPRRADGTCPGIVSEFGTSLPEADMKRANVR